MSATRRDITAPLFQRAQLQSFTGRDGITRRISVPQRGMAIHTPTVWELGSHTPLRQDGASVSASDMLTTPTTTRGGDRWAITATAGTHITAGERGAEQRQPMFMALGGTRLTLARVPPGQIHIPEITVRQLGAVITTTRLAGAQSPGAVITRISTRAIRVVIAALRLTIRTLELSPAEVLVTSGTFTLAPVWQG